MAGMILAGCNDSNTPATTASSKSFQVSITNSTEGQPLSPPAVLVHGQGFSPWVTGQPASVGLEQLAEGGDATQFVSDAMTQQTVYGSATGSGVILPGGKSVFQVQATTNDPAIKMSIASMLVNTNDAFAAKKGIDISNLSVGEALMVSLNALDAGTEANDELQANIPGPAAGGEGFNAQRNDVDRVYGHAGVISQDDGLVTSVLTQAQRFDNPVAKLVITRQN